MELKRDKIKDFNLTKEHLDELLGYLEERLKGMETDLDEEKIYTVINNVIEIKYLHEFGGDRDDVSYKTIYRIIKKALVNQDNKLELWYNVHDIIKRLDEREKTSKCTLRRVHDFEFWFRDADNNTFMKGDDGNMYLLDEKGERRLVELDEDGNPLIELNEDGNPRPKEA